MMNHEVKESIFKLKSFIEKENYRGYDPYDALKSPLLNLPFFRESRNIRFLAQQFVKRFPVNLRPLLLIKKGLNPVTLGLCIQGYSNLEKAGLISKDESEQKCSKLIDHLENLIPEGYNGVCWGYDFPWQSRHFKLGSFQPSVVATGIITNALFKYYVHSKSEKALSLCKSSADFILNDLNTYEDNTGDICFSYTPFDNYKVYNANMKAARILTQVFSATGDKKLFEKAKKAVAFTVKNQNQDGSWFYAPGDKGKWVDNYHTGYILDCMSEYSELTSDKSFDQNIRKGYAYFKNNFFENESIPKFYNNKIYPVDCTSGAQSIITLCRFGDLEHAEKVAGFLIKNMQDGNGSFYFRKYKFNTEKISFMRWSNAWIFAAFSGLSSISAQDFNKGDY